jgi:hypothetical protein
MTEKQSFLGTRDDCWQREYGEADCGPTYEAQGMPLSLGKAAFPTYHVTPQGMFPFIAMRA